MRTRDHLVIALDSCGFDLKSIEKFIKMLYPYAKTFKVGPQFLGFFGYGLAVHVLKTINIPTDIKVFTDLKLVMPPEEMKNFVEDLVAVGSDYFTVSYATGPDSIKAAAEVKGEAKLFVSLIPTWINSNNLDEMGFRNTPTFWNMKSEPQWRIDEYLRSVVFNLAKMAKKCGADGIVCSPKELDLFHKNGKRRPEFQDFSLITPGIRLSEQDILDQKRYAAPAEAIEAGADMLVIGRPILKPTIKFASSESMAYIILSKMRRAFRGRE